MKGHHCPKKLQVKTQQRFPLMVSINTIKDNLKINISQGAINVAYRIGNNTKQYANKPIIVKLHSRQMKQEITNAYITMRPNLFINESLTPKRLSLLKIIWSIRKNNGELFQQCYTKDEKIHIKLRPSNRKHIITNEHNPNSFLDKFPALRANWLFSLVSLVSRTLIILIITIAFTLVRHQYLRLLQHSSLEL